MRTLWLTVSIHRKNLLTTTVYYSRALNRTVFLQDGLSKSDMEKLTFYAVSAPEKLDRIGAYLAERLSRDVVRHRYG